MNKKYTVSLFSFLLILLFVGQPQIYAAGDPTLPSFLTESPTWDDLSKAEKIEAFKYMMESGTCSFEGIDLFGKVEFVDAFPDFTIEYVDAFPDINVKFVDAFPDDCGEWKEVTSFPDFKVKVVTAFPDVKVKIVDAFPGMD